MIKISVLRKMQYEGLSIYVMQFDTTFQYLIPFNGDIYQDHIQLKPSKKNWLMWKLGRRGVPYTADQLDDGEQIILSGAMLTVDKLKSDGKLTRQVTRKDEREANKAEETMRKDREKRSHLPCQWQSRNTAYGFNWTCLVHNKTAKMQEGIKPTHE